MILKGGKSCGYGPLVGISAGMREVYEAIDRVATLDLPVLIAGESGTGKELVAAEIHQRSKRKTGPFVPVNMGAMPTELAASELFGHREGAFTGANSSKSGRFEEARSGTLFLDEIGTMEERIQVYLLRVLETKRFRPLGSASEQVANARVISATNCDLVECAACGRFREDLLHRLQVFQISMPALRERRDDIPLLVRHLLCLAEAELTSVPASVTPEAMQLLASYSWPGNVRELRNVLIQACLNAGEKAIGVEHLPERLISGEGKPYPRLLPQPDSKLANDHDRRPVATPEHRREFQDGVFVPLGASLNEFEKRFVLKTLEYCDYNKAETARMLDVSRKTLYDKLNRWNIPNGRYAVAKCAAALD